jgi:aminopeptidase S
VGAGNFTLSFRYTYALADDADFVRVRVIGATTTTVFKLSGDGAGDWALGVASLTGFAGQTVRIQFEVADRAGASAVAGAVDDVRVIRG